MLQHRHCSVGETSKTQLSATAAPRRSPSTRKSIVPNPPLGARPKSCSKAPAPLVHQCCPMQDDHCWSAPSHRVRPLPPIPLPVKTKTMSAPPNFAFTLPPLVRPLPPPPVPTARPPRLHIIIPSPEQPRVDGGGRLSVPASELPSQSPGSPWIPVRPSPATARRKRQLKLRRHLGERIPASLIFGEIAIAHEKGSSTRVLFERATFAETPDTESRDEDTDVVEDEFNEYLTSVTSRGQSSGGGKCYEEKGGRRWTKDDYGEVMQMLRAL